jgi:hypothetical protein
MNRRRFMPPHGETNREPRKITSPPPRAHGPHRRQESRPHLRRRRLARSRARQWTSQSPVDRPRKKTERGGYVDLHSAVDGYSRLAYPEALPVEKAATAVGFLHRAHAWHAAHGIT